MSIKAKLILSACLSVFASISSSALANDYAYDGEECLNPGVYHQAYVPCISAVEGYSQGWTGNNNNNNNGCFAYNRDGRTCSDVGYSEGQSGTPWGQGAGQFRCTNGCLQFVGQ